MKKLLLLLFLGFLSLQTQAQYFYVTELREGPSGMPVTNYPVWLKVNPAGGGASYVISGITDSFGNYMDTINSPAGSAVVSMTYDCNGNLVSGAKAVQAGRDTLYLTCKSPLSGSSCVVDFHTLSSSAGLTLNLQDSSTYISNNVNRTLTWTFGDGTMDTGVAVSHTYSSPGTYQVCLRSYNYDPFSQLLTCFDSICKNITVSNISPSCHSDYYMTFGNGSVTRYDSSNVSIPTGGTVRYITDFDDGTVDTSYSTQSLFHQYTSLGPFNICYTVEVLDVNGNVVCSDTQCYNTNINFSCNVNVSDSSVANTNVGFFRITSNATGGSNRDVTISFGDGASMVNPTPGIYFSHLYPGPGVYYYSVSLLNYNGPGDTLCTDYYNDSIVIGAPANVVCQANFNYSANPSNILSYTFNSTSTVSGAPTNANITYNWDFGDGVSGSGSSPSHIYSSVGNYNVCLELIVMASNNVDTLCISSNCKTISIVAPNNLNCTASYIVDTANSFNGNVIIWNMSSTDSGATINYQWSFGDGNTSNQAYPSHTYANPGMYEVCLKVTAIRSQPMFPNDSCTAVWCDSLGVDANGNLLYNGKGNGGWVLNVMDPGSISLDESVAGNIEIYPNPTKGKLIVGLAEDLKYIHWNIYDLKGALYLSGRENTGHKHELPLNLEELSSGLYILQIQTEKGVQQFKIQIED